MQVMRSCPPPPATPNQFLTVEQGSLQTGVQEREGSVGTDENDPLGFSGEAAFPTSWTADLENDASKVEGRPFTWGN